MTDRVLRLCLRAYPPEGRKRDGEVLLSLARELSGGGSSSWREAAGLLRAGMAQRARIRWRGLVRAPWTEALRSLALPLAAVHLAVWSAGIAGHPLPLGWWWTLVLGGSALALIGAALRWRAIATAGAVGVFVALAHHGLGAYLEAVNFQTHYASSLGGIALDLDSAMFPAGLVLVLASLALPSRPVVSIRALFTLVALALPAVGLWLLALPGGPSVSELGGALTAALLIVSALTTIWCAFHRRQAPVAGPLGAIVLAVAAPEGVWILPSFLPYDGAWDGVGIAVMLATAVIAPLACLALVGREPPGTVSH